MHKPGDYLVMSQDKHNKEPHETATFEIGLPASKEEEPVAWLQATINATPQQRKAVEAAFEKNGSVCITLADGEDTPIFEPLPGKTPLWPSLTISALFELSTNKQKKRRQKKRIRDRLEAELNREVVYSVLEDQEWVRTCLQDFQPIHCGNDLWIVPSWLKTPEEAKIALKLDPGLAFGTGTHATTFLCLEWIAENPELFKEGQDVIDYGCGSGILGIGAALYGARNIQATDIDAQALLATRMNAEKNEVADAIHTIKPQDLHRNSDFEGHFDVLLANILAEPLMELAPQLASLVKPGGWICMSGLLERHDAGIIENYTPFFESFEVKNLDGWSRVVARRKS